MTEALLIAWLATLGADRIDFLAGSGPFLLTPFLVLTPIILAVEGARVVGRGGTLWVPRQVLPYALGVVALLTVTFVSVLFSVEIEVSAKRYVLLLIQTLATLGAVVFIANRDDPARILVRGAYAGMTLALLFNAIQVGMWLTGNTAAEGGGPERVLFLEPWMYGPWVPRLSGPAIDMNRGGFLFLTYMFLLLQFGRPSRTRAVFLSLGVLSILWTLSRSTLLALLVMAAWLFFRRRTMTISRRAFFRWTLGTAAVALFLLMIPGTVVAVADFLGPALALRFLGDGSSSIHFALMEYALEIGTRSLKDALIGVGFGNSYAVLEEFFPGDKYGNFHSLYLTLWTETGIFSLFLGVGLMLYPFLRFSAYRPLLGAILAFNLFYQTPLEPTFWLVLAAAWADLGVGAHSTSREPVLGAWKSLRSRPAPVAI